MARLNIPDEPTFLTYTVSAAQAVFPFAFAIFAKTDLTVDVGGVALSQADFTLSGTPLENGGYQGGMITLNTAVSSATVTIYRDVAPARASQFAPANTVPVGSIDQALNRLTANLQDAKRDLDRATFDGLTYSKDPTAARTAIGAFASDYQRDAAGAVVTPAFIKLLQTRDLIEFVDRSQWPAIRNFAPTSYATNSFGQDSFQAAHDSLGGGGGEIRMPDGCVRLQPQTITKPNTIIRGRGMCSVIHSASSTADAFDFQASSCKIEGVQIIAIVAKTAGALIRARDGATKFYAEDVETHGGFRSLQLDGHPTDPSLDNGFFTATNFRPFETVVGGEAIYVGGGYVVDIDFLRIAGNNSAQCQAGIRIINCADFRINNAQILNTRRPLLVDPATGKNAASLKLQHSYLGTSLLGSRITDASGGSIVSLDMIDVWAGETSQAGAHGLELVGSGGRFKTAKLTACEFPLAKGDGLNVNGVKGFQCANSWADGNAGSGFALQSMANAQLVGFRSGAERFGGNIGYGLYELNNTRMTLVGNAVGNTAGNFVNGSGTSGSNIQVLV